MPRTVFSSHRRLLSLCSPSALSPSALPLLSLPLLSLCSPSALPLLSLPLLSLCSPSALSLLLHSALSHAAVNFAGAIEHAADLLIADTTSARPSVATIEIGPHPTLTSLSTDLLIAKVCQT